MQIFGDEAQVFVRLCFICFTSCLVFLVYKLNFSCLTFSFTTCQAFNVKLYAN